MTEKIITRRAERQKLIDNLRKAPIYHRLVIDLVEMELDNTRTAYEDTQPASEFLRGQLVALKSLHKELTTQR